MWQRAKCWIHGHEEWSSLDGACFCMRCLRTRNLLTGSSSRWASHTPLDSSVEAAFQTIAKQRSAVRVPVGARIEKLLGRMAARLSALTPKRNVEDGLRWSRVVSGWLQTARTIFF